MNKKHYSFKRSDRIGELLHREIGLILQTKAKDQRLQRVNITGVRATDDLKEATVFFSVIGEDRAEIIESLGKAGSFIRSCIGRSCYLKYVPQLHFKLDRTLEEASRIDRIIQQLHSENSSATTQDETQSGESVL
ncbi:30S ribosome-binding factor RbfA [Gemmatimonadota bacterium]